MITKSIEKLREYDTKVKSRIDDCQYRERDIQEGRKLLFEIQRGELFEYKNGRVSEYKSLVGKEAFEELRNELRKTSNLVKLLKGDISSEVYKKPHLLLIRRTVP